MSDISGSETSAVPTGLGMTIGHVPSNKLLGYYQLSLRDEMELCQALSIPIRCGLIQD